MKIGCTSKSSMPYVTQIVFLQYRECPQNNILLEPDWQPYKMTRCRLALDACFDMLALITPFLSNQHGCFFLSKQTVKSRNEITQYLKAFIPSQKLIRFNYVILHTKCLRVTCVVLAYRPKFVMHGRQNLFDLLQQLTSDNQSFFLTRLC